jgi:hypothetical protein
MPAAGNEQGGGEREVSLAQIAGFLLIRLVILWMSA